VAHQRRVPHHPTIPVPDANFAQRLFYEMWTRWIQNLLNVVNMVVFVKYHADDLVEQDAAIAATNINEQPLTEGLYRISWYLRPTQAATTSSSIQVRFGWTDDGVALTSTAAAIATNLTTSVQSGSILVYVEGDTDITYETLYASVGATPMHYHLEVDLEQIS
jgi:hypothetical protein